MNETTTLLLPVAAHKTFGMIKPDATKRGVEEAMITDMTSAGFRVLESRRTTLERADAEWLYREHKDRSHFNDLVDYTISGEVILLQLEHNEENAAAAFRSLMGPTDRTQAASHTLRARYAVGYRENSIHGSDSPESAAAELAYFFSG